MIIFNVMPHCNNAYNIHYINAFCCRKCQSQISKALLSKEKHYFHEFMLIDLISQAE